MPAKSKREAKPKIGRPVEPDSLRQAGVGYHMLMARDEKDRWENKARAEGKSLADIIRKLLVAWEQGKRS